MSRLNLMLHCGGQEIARHELAQVPCPESTSTWQPIPHDRMVDGVINSLERSGLNIVAESHGLTRDGNQYFGTMQIANEIESLSNESDYGLVVGMRNSHDKTFPAGLCVGAGVFVCDNLSFSGEITLARKHTRYIQRDLPGLIGRAVGQLGDHRNLQALRIDKYKATELSDSKVHDLVIHALDSRVIGATQVPRVLAEWRKPSHDEFGPRNAWSLFNSFTEIFKAGNAARTLPRSQRLHGILDATCGLAGLTMQHV